MYSCIQNKLWESIIFDGLIESIVGLLEGTPDGSSVGVYEGEEDGFSDGFDVILLGWMVGINDGIQLKLTQSTTKNIYIS